jgi:hypothetical protein
MYALFRWHALKNMSTCKIVEIAVFITVWHILDKYKLKDNSAKMRFSFVFCCLS